MAQMPSPTTGLIVAKASWDYRWRRFALVLVMLGYGVWSGYDGFKHMPAVNAQDKKDHPGIEILRYSDLDIQLNKAFAFGLPPLSIVFLGWVLYASRGSYRFDGTTISVPGHQNIPVKAVRKVNRDKWDRKGIAYLQYQIAGSAKLGTMKLDDFIYQRVPTDTIFARVEAAVEEAKTPVLNVPQQRVVCSHCGVQNSPTAAVCTNCGGPL